MGYKSQISFTLDTICPWTYLAKRRLAKALAQVGATNPAVTFTVRYLPYQLYPAATQDGEDKYEWYRKSRYGDSEEKMKMYVAIMTAYGDAEGIAYRFGGTVANTLEAHRMIYLFQEERGPEVADKIVSSLYRQYFEEEKHPSSPETLTKAAADAGISKDEVETFMNDKGSSVMDVQALVRQQASDGVDSVPYIVIEGKKRDFTLVGCKEVDEYVKALQQVIKESS